MTLEFDITTKDTSLIRTPPHRWAWLSVLTSAVSFGKPLYDVTNFEVIEARETQRGVNEAGIVDLGEPVS